MQNLNELFVQWVVELWWVYGLVAIGVLGGVHLFRRSQAQQIHAQFVATSIGCLMMCFYGIGIISAILSAIASTIKIWTSLG